MKSKWVWWLSQVARRIWFRATLFSILAVATALAGAFLSPYIPADLPTKIGADSVDKILGIIASSMLTVTTFSLSTMVSAYSAATSNVTPRATRLVMEDSTTQNVLATFVGSFLFSLVGIIAMTTGAYGEKGRIILYVATIAIIVLIVVTLLRWIDHLSRLGRVTETTERVEQATAAALKAWCETPCLGGHPLLGEAFGAGAARTPIHRTNVGYVQHVDAGALSAIADKADIEIAVLAIAGTLVVPNVPVAWINKEVSNEIHEEIGATFTIGDVRSFDQDPRFGASVLAEIASRALSKAVNDPGTAIDVISRAIRTLDVWSGSSRHTTTKILYPRLHVLSINIADLFDDLFTPIARDGASIVEVGLRLQKAFVALAHFDDREFRKNALRHSREAMERAEAELTIDADIRRIRLASEALTDEKSAP